MYKYAATDSIFDGVSNIYLISIATAFLAVIIALYCSNFLKDESEKRLKEVLREVGEGYEDEEGATKKDDYLNDTISQMENRYQLQQEVKGHFHNKELETSSDYEYDKSYKNIYTKDNYSTNENSDDEFDSDEIQVDGLVGKLKSKRAKELEAQLTKDQLEEERRIEREQLAAIFELLKKQEAELNLKEIDESELNAQLALYR